MKHQHAFANDLAVLLRSGTPLEQALSLLERHHPDADFQAVITSLKQHVQQGLPLSEAIGTLVKEQPKHGNKAAQPAFSDLFIGMIKSGEASANLPAALTKLAEQLERDDNLRQKITSSLIYPAILIIGMFLSLIVMFAVVIPQFADLFNEHAERLSPIAKGLMYLGDFINAWGLWLLLAMFGSIAWAWQSVGGLGIQNKARALLQKIPVVADLYNQIDYARFCYSLSSLLNSGLSQTQALEIAADSFEQDHNKAQIDDIIERLNSGQTLGACFPDLKGINPLFAHSIANAETAGELPMALENMASRLEKDFSDKTLRLTQVIEPALVLILGVVIGIIVYALFSSLASLGDLAV